MGKRSEGKNRPLNPSLSYTLENLQTKVCLQPHTQATDSWSPLIEKGFIAPYISENGQIRYLKHLGYLKSLYDYQGSFLVKSANNFPMDAGLASSASSFAALTKAANMALSELTGKNLLDTDKKLALASQKGSGSSCRSFFSPWAIWSDSSVEPIDLPYQKLSSVVIIADEAKKSVSSSLAHQQVLSSPLFKLRAHRANQRLEALLQALKYRQWPIAYQIVYDEFMDMHQLFETSSPSFSYFNQTTRNILNDLNDFWQDKNDGPLITMDAGANVHLLFHEEQVELQASLLERYIKGKYRVIF